MKRLILVLTLALGVSGCVRAPVSKVPTAPTVGFGGADADFGGAAQPASKLGARMMLSYPACTPVGGVQCTTPYGLWLPPHGYPNWDGPMNANTAIINTQLQAAAGGHPASPGFYLQGSNSTATGFSTDSSVNPFKSNQISASVNSALSVTAPPYNAVADALSTVDGVMSSGSTTLTSASGLFLPSVVGKTISVQFAGGTSGSQQPLVTTIASYVSPTQLTLASPATQAAGGSASATTLTDGGTSGYVTANGLATTTSGSGLYAKVNIIASGGVITSATIVGGLGYAVNDKIYPTQGGSSADAYLTVTAVTNAGVIWGTDNFPAFNTWMTALPGHAGSIPCNVPGQGYLLNTQSSTLILNFSSNEDIKMDRSCTLYYVGTNFSQHGRHLFFGPSGTTNVTIDGLRVTGEWLNTTHLDSSLQGFGNGNAIQFANSGAPSSHFKVINSTFQNLFGQAIADYNTADFDHDIERNIFQDNNDESVNDNASDIIIAHNHFYRGSAAMEIAAAHSKIDDNIMISSGGASFVASLGGNLGAPYQGTQFTANTILSPLAANGCISVTDGFEYGLIADNTCYGLLTGAGIDVKTFGYQPVNYNVISNNKLAAAGPTGATTGIEITSAIGTILTGNQTQQMNYGFQSFGSTGTAGSGNIWDGRSQDVDMESSSTASLRDKLVNGVYQALGGSTFNNDTSLYYAGAATGFALPPPQPNPFVGAQFVSAHNDTVNNATNTPFNSVSGTTGGYAITRLYAFNPNNSVIDFGPIGVTSSGGLNNSHTWAGAEYNGDNSSNFAVFTAMGGSSALTPIQSVRALTLATITASNTTAYGAMNGSFCVGRNANCSDPGIGNIAYTSAIVGPATAPTAGSSCTAYPYGAGRVVTSQDGKYSYCNGAIWVQPFGAGVFPASLVTTAATTDNVTVTGMTSSGHCTIGATNAAAATDLANTYISAKTTNQITVTHTATANENFDILCTAN